MWFAPQPKVLSAWVRREQLLFPPGTVWAPRQSRAAKVDHEEADSSILLMHVALRGEEAPFPARWNGSVLADVKLCVVPLH